MDPPKRVPKEPPYPPPPVMVDYSSGDASEAWGGWTAAGYNVKQDDSAGSVPEPAGVPAPKTPPLDIDPEWQWRNLEFAVEASSKGKKKKNKGVKKDSWVVAANGRAEATGLVGWPGRTQQRGQKGSRGT